MYCRHIRESTAAVHLHPPVRPMFVFPMDECTTASEEYFGFPQREFAEPRVEAHYTRARLTKGDIMDKAMASSRDQAFSADCLSLCCPNELIARTLPTPAHPIASRDVRVSSRVGSLRV
jgi:hypothetical protein